MFRNILDQLCTITDLPSNGFAFIWNKKTDKKKFLNIGDIVDDAITIEYHCATDHQLEGESSVKCEKGQWTTSMPKCQSA